MGRQTRKPLLLIPLLVYCFSKAAAFLVEEGSNGETLQNAFLALQEVNNRLNNLEAENQQLKSRLQASESSYAQMLSDLGSRVFSDYVWYGDWILAFRATQGIGQPVYDAWTNVGHHDDDPLIRDTLPCGCTTINGSLPCDRHYRSRVLDSWPSASIDQVKVVLYENGVEKEHVTFTGTGSDYMSWFSHPRVAESSWTDLKNAGGINIFSIVGDTSNVMRRFFISHVYQGCPGDVGWMVVKDSVTDPCKWATVQAAPAFLYSPGSHEVTWDSHGYRQADVMAVFVKFRPAAEPSEVCFE